MRLLCLLLLTISSYCFAHERAFILMRHGQADHNVNDVYSSNPSHPNYEPSHLTAEGRQKAEETAQDLISQGFHPTNISKVYVSPLPRTQETAQVLVEAGLITQDQIVIDPRIIEIQVGDLEGKPIIRPWTEADTLKYHSESDAHIQARARAFYEEIESSCDCRSVIVVTHAPVAKEIMTIMGFSDVKKLEPGQAVVLRIANPIQ